MALNGKQTGRLNVGRTIAFTMALRNRELQRRLELEQWVTCKSRDMNGEAKEFILLGAITELRLVKIYREDLVCALVNFKVRRSAMAL
jgi:hypothetical protein